MEIIEEAKLRLALLKENFEYQGYFTQFLEWDKKSLKGVWPGLGFNKFGLIGLRYYIHHPLYKYDKIMDLINPQKDSNMFPEKYKNLLPKLFYDPAVSLIEIGETKIDSVAEGVFMPVRVVFKKGLKPYERLYKVDLSKKKVQIMKEFKRYIDGALSEDNEKDWIPYKKRNRKETWVHLNVWSLRKQRKSFSEISDSLCITIDAAKKSFYRAYELTQGKRYDPEFLRKEIWCVKKTDIKKTCDNCLVRATCDTLCPDVLRYVDQDNTPLRENYLSEDSDSLRDYLIQKHS